MPRYRVRLSVESGPANLERVVEADNPESALRQVVGALVAERQDETEEPVGVAYANPFVEQLGEGDEPPGSTASRLDNTYDWAGDPPAPESTRQEGD
jgi:hypothetical protein